MCMLRTLIVFYFVCVCGRMRALVLLGLTLNVAAFSLCIRGMLDPVDNFTVHSVTIKCLRIIVLSLAAHTGSALGSLVSSGWAVSQL